MAIPEDRGIGFCHPWLGGADSCVTFQGVLLHLMVSSRHNTSDWSILEK